jgi:parallel beta-helix repeat protein
MPISVISTFSGSGNYGDVLSFTTPVPMEAGDVYLIAFAANGRQSYNVAPRNAWVYPWGSRAVSSAYFSVNCAMYNVGAPGAGESAFTVTFTYNGADAATGAVFGYVLRGVYINLAERLTGNGISAYTFIGSQTASGYVPCAENAVTIQTGNNPVIAMTVPVNGAFGIFASAANPGTCEGVPPTLAVGGDLDTVVYDTFIDGAATEYRLGTLGATGFCTGAQTGTIATLSAEHGVAGGLVMYAVYPALPPDTPEEPPAEAITRPSLVVHRNIFAGCTTKAIGCADIEQVIVENNSIQDSAIAATLDACHNATVADNTISGCTDDAIQIGDSYYSVVTGNTIRDAAGATTAAIALVGAVYAKVAENRIAAGTGTTVPDYAVSVDATSNQCAIINNDFRGGYTTGKVDDLGGLTTEIRNLPEAAVGDDVEVLEHEHEFELDDLADVDAEQPADGATLVYFALYDRWMAVPSLAGEVLTDANGDFIYDDNVDILYDDFVAQNASGPAGRKK